MIEIKGNLWDHYNKPGTVILITTNGTLKKNGAAVMGRGCAKEVRDKFPTFDKLVGTAIKNNGNVINMIQGDIWTFPVKHNWWEAADLRLIAQSALGLYKLATESPDTTFILPRPGCGNGKLNWKDVQPLLAFLPDNVKVISF